MRLTLDKHLHIISLDVPYPVDYGGVYDLFYKLPALQAQGVKIHLHCFDGGKGPQPQLDQYCETVQYYPRNTGYKGISGTMPYIVASRKNEALCQNLLQDNYPIFMEGVHCTYPAFDQRFNNRKKFVRIHNVENIYYRQLFGCTDNLLKKIYYAAESRLLKKYEQALVTKATAFWAVTEKDTQYYRHELHCNTMDYLPLYLPEWTIKSKPGMGTYCLYHGNLEVKENEFAAEWLLQNVFNKIEIPFVIAGKNPSPKLQKMADAKLHTCLVANPGEKEMQEMIEKAQMHILPSYNDTGIKIKLLNALYNGRHCLVNSQAVDGTGLGELCHIADEKSELIALIEKIFHQPFQQYEIEGRTRFLNSHFNNEKNAKQMVEWIWNIYA